MAIEERVLGDQSLSEELLRVIEGAVAEGEPIRGILATLAGNAVVATDQRLLFPTEETVELELGYEDITGIEIRTGWWSRGITFLTSEGGVQCDVSDRDAVVAMADIIRERAPHIDVPESDGESGGLMGRVKGVVDTATGQDIRKFEEFVEAATTVLVGLHRDQTAMAEKQLQLEDGIESVRESQETIDAKLDRLDEAIGELRERIDASNQFEGARSRDGSIFHKSSWSFGTICLAAIILVGCEYCSEVRLMESMDISEYWHQPYTSFRPRVSQRRLARTTDGGTSVRCSSWRRLRPTWALMTSRVSGLNLMSTHFIREAFERQFPGMSVESLAGSSPEYLQGIVNGVKGKYFEILIRDRLGERWQRGRSCPWRWRASRPTCGVSNSAWLRSSGSWIALASRLKPYKQRRLRG